jgi:hypothetical protein
MGKSDSDRLAIALTCLAGIMAIVLFLVEKTPATVIGLLLGMAALSVYPVWHFVRGRVARFVVLVCGVLLTVLFGRGGMA